MEVFKLQGVVKVLTAGADKSLKKVEKHAERVGKSFEKMGGRIDLAVAKSHRLEAPLKRLEAMNRKVTMSYLRMANAITKVAGQQRKMASTAARSSNQNLNATSELNSSLKNVLGSFVKLTNSSKGLRKVESAADRATKGVNRLNKATKATSASMKFLKRAAANALANLASSAAIALWTSFVRGGTEAIDTIKEFNVELRSMNGLAKLNEKDLALVSESLRTIGRRTGLGVNSAEAAGSLKEILAVGFDDPEQARIVNEEAVQFAKADNLDIVKTGKFLGASLKAFNADASQARRFANIILGSADIGSTDITELAQSSGRVLPQAANLGISPEEIFAAIGLGTRGGTRTETVVAGLGSALRGVTSPTPKTQKGLDSLGLQDLGEDSILADGLFKTLEKIREATGGTQAGLEKIFKRKESVTAVLAVLNQGRDEAEKAVGVINSNIDRVAIRNEQNMKAAGNQFDLLKSNLESFAIFVGGDLESSLADFLMGVNDNMPALNDIARELVVIGKEVLHIFTSLVSGDFLAKIATSLRVATELFFLFNDALAIGFGVIKDLIVKPFRVLTKTIPGIFRFIVLKVLQLGQKINEVLLYVISGAFELLPDVVKDQLGIASDFFEHYAAGVEQRNAELQESLNNLTYGENVTASRDAFAAAIEGVQRRANNRANVGRAFEGDSVLSRVNPARIVGDVQDQLGKVFKDGKVDVNFLANAVGFKKAETPSAKAERADIDTELQTIERGLELERISSKAALDKFKTVLQTAKEQEESADTIFEIEKKIFDLTKDITAEKEKADRKSESAAKKEEAAARKKLELDRKLQLQFLEGVKGKTAAKLQKLRFDKEDQEAAGADQTLVDSAFRAEERKILDKDKEDKADAAKKKDAETVKATQEDINLDANLAASEGDILREKILKLKAALVEELVLYKDNEEKKLLIKKTFLNNVAKLEKNNAKKVAAATLDLNAQVANNQIAALNAKGETEKAARLERKISNEQQFQEIKNKVEAFRKAGVNRVEIEKFITSEQARIRREAKAKEKAEEQQDKGGSKSPLLSLDKAFSGKNDFSFGGGFKFGTRAFGTKKDPASAASAAALAGQVGGLRNGLDEAKPKTSEVAPVDLNIRFLDSSGTELSTETFSGANSDKEQSSNFNYTPKGF